MVRIKKIIKKKKTNPEFDDRNELEIFNEINILKQIDRRGVLNFFEFCGGEYAFYLITEYCEGVELFILTEKQYAYIIYQVLSAIKYCHKIKIMIYL